MRKGHLTTKDARIYTKYTEYLGIAFRLKDTKLYGNAAIFLDRLHSVCLVFLVASVPCG